MKLTVSLNDFKQYLRILDGRLSVYRDNENQNLYRIEYPVEIFAIGGFALMYYDIRFSGTENIDSAKRIEEPVKKLVRDIAFELELPIDWLNDVPASGLFYEITSYRWMK